MKNILIVDDDRDVFESMKIVLEAEGYRVDWATNGSEALQKAKAARPDLMILDVMMNSDDEGFQVTYKMKQDRELSCIPIVMVTSVGSRTGFSFDRKRDEDLGGETSGFGAVFRCNSQVPKPVEVEPPLPDHLRPGIFGKDQVRPDLGRPAGHDPPRDGRPCGLRHGPAGRRGRRCRSGRR